MFGIGGVEFVALCLIAILLVGPKQLPVVARELAIWIKKIRKFRDHWSDEIRKDPSIQELRREVNKVEQDLSEPVREFKSSFEQETRKWETALQEETIELSSEAEEPTDGYTKTEIYTKTEAAKLEGAESDLPEPSKTEALDDLLEEATQLETNSRGSKDKKS
ncbi:MAG: hypothetical protein EA369_08030 [Bradymonadales bacterium]|nr:MAG: hypothetical protein EA369_08030 [Bradymonadales bacterium]